MALTIPPVSWSRCHRGDRERDPLPRARRCADGRGAQRRATSRLHVVSITVSLIAVFFRFAHGGIIGRLFREFAVTLSVAIAVSALVSLTLTPMMCSRLLSSPAAKGDERHGALYRASNASRERLSNGYARGLRWVLGHHRLTLFITLSPWL